MPEPINPAEVMAAHAERTGYHGDPYCADGCPEWPCEPYRLAEALAAAQRDLAAEQEKVQRAGALNTDERVQSRCEHPASGWFDLCPEGAPHADYLLIRRSEFRAALAGEGAADQPKEPTDA